MQSEDDGENRREQSIIDTGTLATITKSELDQQIATAKAYPRSIAVFRKRALELVTLTEPIAKSCIYALPRREKDRHTGKFITKIIEGPSIRFAEVIASSWGNIRRGARIVHEGREFITGQGVCHDLETNDCVTREIQRRITTSTGKRYNADMIGVTANAACSIAMRNAVLGCIPQAIWAEMFAAARRVVAGDVKTLANRRAAAIAEFTIFGVTEPVILATLGRAGVQDITIDDLVTLNGMLTAIKDGEHTAEQLFNIDGEDNKEEKPTNYEPKARAPNTPRAPGAVENPGQAPAVDAQSPGHVQEPTPATATPKLSEEEEREALTLAFGGVPAPGPSSVATPASRPPDIPKSNPPKFQQPANGGNKITKGALQALERALQKPGARTAAAICEKYGVERLEEIRIGEFNEVMKFAEGKE